MTDAPLFRNRFGEVFSDRLVLYSSVLGDDAPKGESLDFTSVQKISVQTEHPRNAILEAPDRWSHGRFAVLGFVMFGIALIALGVWHLIETRWPALVPGGKFFPMLVGALMAMGIGALFYPYRLLVTLHGRRLQSTHIGSLKEARAFVKAARAALRAASRR